MNDERFSIALRIVHPVYSADVIVGALGMVPDVANSVGVSRSTPAGRKLEGEYRETYCAFTLQGKRTGHFVDGVKELLPLVRSHAEFFDSVRRTGGKVELYIGVFVEGSSGFTLSSDDMGDLSEVRVDLSVEYYF